MNRLCVAIVVLLLTACDCGDGTLGGVDVGFRVSGQTVDFGRVLEGTKVTREVELVSDSRANVVVEVATLGPFSAPVSVTVPAGSTARVPVTFTAGSMREEGRLLLGPADDQVAVGLTGEGVRPLDCQPSAVCRSSEFDLATNACVEAASDEGDICVAPNVCLENGSCRSGACVGTARTCDDDNRCTVDGCSETTGCVNAPRACPQPTKACRVPTCDPLIGCGEAFAQDGTLCGRVDCVTVQLCLSGECTEVATPEGFVCSPPTPCQGEGRCTQQQCVRPDGGEMTPEFSAAVRGALVQQADAPTLLAHNGNVFFDVCGLNDGGCELVSYTPTGFLRFNRGHGDAAARWVQFVSDAGVVVNDRQSLEAFSLNNGARLWKWTPDASVGSASVVLLRDGGVAALLDDDALAVFSPDIVTDGGGTAVSSPLPSGALGASASDVLVSWAWTDGGVTIQGGGSYTVDAGSPNLVINSGAVFVAGASVIGADGGVYTAVDPSGPASRALLGRHVLAADALAYVFSTACTDAFVATCVNEERYTEVRAISLADGTTRWETRLLPAFVNARVEEAAVVDLLGGGVISVSDVATDAGVNTYLQLVVDGSRVFACPLPAGGRTQGAVFDRGRLFVLMERGGASRLEAYDLKGVPLSTTGWPQRNGVAGTRRER